MVAGPSEFGDNAAGRGTWAGPLSAAATQWLVQLRAEQELGALLELLRTENIDPLVVKGFALAQQVYGDVADRPLRDVDLRVLPSELARAERVALRGGFTRVQKSRSYGNVVLERGGQAFDLETVVGAPFLTRLRIEDLRARAHHLVTRGGLRILVPNMTDHALLLAVNVYKDKFTEAAPYALDDARRIASQPEFSRSEFVARSHACNMHTLCFVVATWFAARGSEAWQQVAVELGRPRRAAFLGALAQLEVRGAAQSVLGRALYRLVSDAPQDRLRSLMFASAFELETRLRAHLRQRQG